MGMHEILQRQFARRVLHQKTLLTVKYNPFHHFQVYKTNLSCCPSNYNTTGLIYQSVICNVTLKAFFVCLFFENENNCRCYKTGNKHPSHLTLQINLITCR